MGFKQTLFSSIFWRSMISDFGGRGSIGENTREFTPYFQYKIEKYQSDFYLYFPQAPYLAQYKNEVFNKLAEYTGYEIIRYLTFHYERFENKTDFLHFLRYEANDRLNHKPSLARRTKLSTCIVWVEDRLSEHRRVEVASLKTEIEQEVQKISVLGREAEPEDIAYQVETLTQKLVNHVDNIMDEAETRFQSLSQSYAANIQLNNRNNEEKLIQLFVLIQQIQSAGRPPEQLFKNISAQDITLILLYHFGIFKGKRNDTVYKKVSQQIAQLQHKNPKVKKLEEALQEFFY